MTSEVFGITLRTHFRESLDQKMLRLFQALRPQMLVAPGAIWAIKIHFGEAGGHTFIRPHLIRVLVEALKESQAKPFLTDSNTLYVGGRTNSVDHLETALRHGFGLEVTGAPLIIADGLRGESAVPVEVGSGGVDRAWIGAEIAAADGLLVLSHFKGHELTGFGGALKNLGMGSAARRGKLDQHSDLKPKVIRKKCLGCGRCLRYCAHQALKLAEVTAEQEKHEKEADIVHKKAVIDEMKCVGCAVCISACPSAAIAVPWERDSPKVMRKMMEYAKAALKGKEGRALFINFLTNISPLCDCVNHSDAPIVSDLGILASYDPVALDAASAEAVNQAPGLAGSALPAEGLAPGADKWAALHPNCPWRYQLEYAREIGLGQLDYRLAWLPEAKGV